MTITGLERLLALGQGVYFVVSGVWPLLSLRSFEKVTGPKADGWLVKTVGVLVAATGATLVRASRRDEVPSEARLLAATSAAGLAAVEVVYVRRGRISKVYLLDAAAETGLAGAWVAGAAARRLG